MTTTGTVRPAEAADLPLIQEWLKYEVRDGLGFINNWNLIQEACAEQQMTVYVTEEGPVGFITQSISYGTILQTKSSCQRQGIGRALVEHAISAEEALNNAVLMVQCEPKGSVSFWSAMGFEGHREANYTDAVYMHRLSSRVNPDVQGDDLHLVTITVYPESALYANKQIPDRVHYVMGKFNPDARTVTLTRRISIANESALDDPVIEINWEGFEIYKGKAKHDGAAAAGIQSTPNGYGWYLDIIEIDGQAE
ncbi:N-acetyltransferase family protein [Pseudomonas aeruginosa]|uniref:GNAT family N-acetyltransferase n=1 Tax=Pseudomonas aeruginosa group TaxID=136841 RepID=UPI0004483B42|nr:GNAT family N-acetyltransferase [Pseudomonas aeruginosa]EIU2716158.1 GNAT family N-acetyltransferase [Pseudomonas aeruginosa]EIU2862977.1 GNAT family N-acetyltransferase [Pseudomonas aeruginosa]ELD5772762.1 GNAT family N-acetyltransferase [Pseudomonas aeruginosa]ETV28877.1 hypothetical protein Q046_05794 [Pseudomonas aeruginosa BWHPSA041]MBA5210098.1 GNAT family N-acetyltransferase [Pseudomonas aeruginosa]